jgi:hypothetical protein
MPKVITGEKEVKDNGKEGNAETKAENKAEGEVLELHPTVVKWNEFIDHLLRAKELWEEMNTELPDRTEREISFPYQAQLIFSMFEHQDFTVMIPRFTDYWRGYGGLEVMKS